MVGDDYYPLDVTDFSTAISKIQAAKPDYVHSCLVGGPHMSFYRQWAAAGMLHKVPIVSIVFAGGNEHTVLTPEETDGIVVAYNYFEEIDTPDNKAFLKRVTATAGPDHPYVNGIAIGGYTGPMIWAEAVKRARQFRKRRPDGCGRPRHRMERPEWSDGLGRQDPQHAARRSHHTSQRSQVELD